jgi:adenylate kinase family enzyme
VSPRRVLIFGNSGSGKSTLARRLAAEEDLVHLDLDILAWEVGKVAVQRPLTAVRADLDAFVAANPGWVVEGCYGDLVEALLPACTELVFLNPGREACLAHNLRRPWEPHKHATPEAQDAMLACLQDWVADYYEREGPMSLKGHRRIFEGFGGPKREVTLPMEA